MIDLDQLKLVRSVIDGLKAAGFEIVPIASRSSPKNPPEGTWGYHDHGNGTFCLWQIHNGETANIGTIETNEACAQFVCEKLNAPPVSPEWQPIETAPKDGTDVLVVADGVVSEAEYWGDDRGWWLANTAPTDYIDSQVWPTHWMPLPPPPTT